jgi:prepilin-type N-terminal cleavage/methylation domain-containing protein
MTSRPRVGAFTLIEVLVVVAIIALLVAILIPSLALAREQARIVKCTAHLSNFPKATYMVSTDHKGYGPLIGRQDEWENADPSHTKYDYQQGMFGASGQQLKPWPLALARTLGEASLKRAEQYYELAYKKDPSYFFGKYGKHEIYLCPSDKDPVHDVWSPRDMYGVCSYAANEDVLGITNPTDCEGQCWKDGRWADTKPPRAPRLEGRLDRIVRPSEVVLYCDGGNEDSPTTPDLLITTYQDGPYISNFEHSGRLPHFRHSSKGGLTTGLADGSGRYLKPLRFESTDAKYVERYEPRGRITPYNPW